MYYSLFLFHHLEYVFTYSSQTPYFKQKISTRVNQKKIKSSEKNMSRERFLNFD